MIGLSIANAYLSSILSFNWFSRNVLLRFPKTIFVWECIDISIDFSKFDCLADLANCFSHSF